MCERVMQSISKWPCMSCTGFLPALSARGAEEGEGRKGGVGRRMELDPEGSDGYLLTHPYSVLGDQFLHWRLRPDRPEAGEGKGSRRRREIHPSLFTFC